VICLGRACDVFKRNLDNFLRLLPDEPRVPGYTARRRTDSNGLLDLQGIIRNIAFTIETESPEEDEEEIQCSFGGRADSTTNQLTVKFNIIIIEWRKAAKTLVQIDK